MEQKMFCEKCGQIYDIREKKLESEDEVGFYYDCSNCKFTEKLLPGTIIYSSNESKDIDDVSHMVNNETPHTINNYICDNPKCETHSKPELKKASLIPDRKKQITIIICKVCATQMIL